MTIKSSYTCLFAVMALGIVGTTGCMFPLSTTLSPTVAVPWPIPVTAYAQKVQEDSFWHKERYEKVPIMGPITAGGPAMALDPPSEDEVIRALERVRSVQRGVPLFHEVQRNNVRIIIEPIADYVDPPRVYPTVGPAQLHHAHYKCTVHFTEITRPGWPIPYTTVNEEAQEVIYIDHSHLHRVGNLGDEAGGAPPPHSH